MRPHYPRLILHKPRGVPYFFGGDATLDILFHVFCLYMYCITTVSSNPSYISYIWRAKDSDGRSACHHLDMRSRQQVFASGNASCLALQPRIDFTNFEAQMRQSPALGYGEAQNNGAWRTGMGRTTRA